MRLLDGDFAVSHIDTVVRVPYSGGTPLHTNRPLHGLALYVGCSGVYRFFDGVEITVKPGEIIYLPKNSSYTSLWLDDACVARESRGVYAINFSLVDGFEECPPSLFRITASDEILSAFVKADNAWRKKDVGFLEECYINLYGIIKIIKREVSAFSGSEKRLTQLKPALDYIRNSYTFENITAPYLAALCGISEPYLRKLFEREFSVSPMVYIRNMRIKYATELIASGEYSVTDAAMMSGFNDNAYFSREFKKTMGISPKEYKNSLKSKL